MSREKPGCLTQVLLADREFVAGAQHAADVPHQRDLLQRLRAFPAIDRQRQRAPHARIVEGLLLRVEAHDQAADPRRFDDDGLVAQRLHEAIPVRRRLAAELGQHLAAREGVDHRRAADEHRPVAVEVRLAGLEVAVELLADPVRAGLVLDERERAGAQDVALGELGIDLELGGAVDAVPRRGEARQHRRVGSRQLEHDRVRVGGVDAGDVLEGLLADRLHAGRRLAQPVVGRSHVLRRHRRPVVELDVAPELERVGEAVGRDGPRLGEIADDLRIVRGVELEQRRVVRAHRMEEGERRLRVAVVVRRLGADREHERAARLGRLRECLRRPDGKHGCHQCESNLHLKASFCRIGSMPERCCNP